MVGRKGRPLATGARVGDHYADRPMSAPDRFDPDSFRSFRIVGRAYEPDTRTITFRYALDDRVSFTETVTFETPPEQVVDPVGPGFERPSSTSTWPPAPAITRRRPRPR